MSANPKITDWRGQRVWLIGASSGIGAALAQAMAAAGARLALSGRRREALQDVVSGALIQPFDASEPGAAEAALTTLLADWGRVDLVVYLAGDYQAMPAAQAEAAAMRRLWAVNYAGAADLAAALVPRALAGEVGGMAFVASVAGYRGLPKALAYGPPKAALIHLAEILHLELAPQGIGVWLIDPGFVATRLTAKNDFAMPALLTPEEAAAATLRGFARGAFEIAYPPAFTATLRWLAKLPYALWFPLIRRLTREGR